MPRWFVFFIFIFWAVMMSLLVQKDVLSGFQDSNATGYETILIAEQIATPTRMQIYIGTRPVGTTESNVDIHADGSFVIHHLTRLDFEKLNMPRFSMEGMFSIDQQFQLSSLLFQIRSGEKQLAHIRGSVKDNVLNVLIRTAQGEVIREAIALPRHGIVASSLSPFMPMQNLKVGKRWTISLFSPLTMDFSQIQAHVTRREMISWQEKMIGTYVVELSSKGSTQSTAWYSEEGFPLKVHLPLGIRMIKMSNVQSPASPP